MRRLLTLITDELPCRSINGLDGRPYLNRYHVMTLGPDANPWFSVYIHKFKASDPDLGYHDHPWGWAWSWVLAGRYTETTPTGRRIRRRFSLGRLTGDSLHRVVLAEGDECWTLFVHGRRTKGWGFFRPFRVGRRADHAVMIDARLPFPYTYHPEASSETDSPAAGWWQTAPNGKYVRASDV